MRAFRKVRSFAYWQCRAGTCADASEDRRAVVAGVDLQHVLRVVGDADHRAGRSRCTEPLRCGAQLRLLEIERSHMAGSKGRPWTAIHGHG